ncbi:MAG: TolC family protein [Chitinophagales bacterium]|jgi:outer membrane protein TolC|nr:TolC family protein [Bacteroidota bacterium]MBK9555824.1 TolC family protein [Bacteroidota bacterium]MBL0279407.1 TolC family protein [Bacteroidota bacterium]MBP9881055.1 TolC family protein [Chitinophagales bacterium]
MKINHFKILISILFVVTQLTTKAQQLTLNEAKAIMLSNNYGIIIQKLETDISGLQNSAGFAGMLPTVTAEAAYNTELSNSEQQYFSGDVRSVDNAGANALDAGVYINWTLFDGFAMFATKDKLNEFENLSQLQLKQQIETAMFNLQAMWFQLIQLKEAETVNKSNIAVSTERLNIAGGRERLGAASRLDVLQAEVDLSADSTSLLQTQLQLKNVKANINNLLGRSPETDFDTDEKIEIATSLNYNDLLAKTIEANTDLQIAKNEVDIIALGIKEYKAMLYPELNLIGGYGYLRSTSESGFVESNLNYGPSVGLTLSVPLFNGLTTTKNLQIARIEQEKVVTTTQQIQLELNTILLTIYNQYTTSLYLMNLEQKNIAAAQGNVAIAIEKYNLGNITAVELRDIQQSLLQAKNRLLVETLNAKLAELQLLKLSGQLPLN